MAKSSKTIQDTRVPDTGDQVRYLASDGQWLAFVTQVHADNEVALCVMEPGRTVSIARVAQGTAVGNWQWPE